MEFEEKLKRAKKLIFYAWIISISWDLILQVLSGYGFVEYDGTGIEQWWIIVVFVLATFMMFYGLWLGSRSIGAPLSFGRFWNLLFGYPCWIPVSIYLITNLIIPVIYFEFIR